MKKTLIPTIISSLLILSLNSCKTEKQKILKLLEEYQHESFLPITPEQALNYRDAEKLARTLIDINNFDNPNRVFLLRSKFEIEYKKLYSYCEKIPDEGYLFCEYGLKNKIENHNKGFDISDLNLKLSYLDKDYNPINGDVGIIFNFFENSSKTNLYEAYEILHKEQMTHFDPRINKAAVIFKKSDTIDWLKKPELDANKNITFEQISAWKKTSILVFGFKKNKPNEYLYGNRGQQCCPPQQ